MVTHQPIGTLMTHSGKIAKLGLIARWALMATHATLFDHGNR